jgi:glycolate oxidase FAD binding subunit
LEHAADDLIVRVEAGLSLDALQHAVAVSGQMLALNPPDQGGSIGGIIASNTSGYRRQHYGTARDLLIGITVVLADGTVAKSGGKVVKNVAGYDLAKLYTGSLGTLGLIVEAIFRLHPRAPAHRCVTLALKDSSDAGAVVHALRTAMPPVVLDALEVRWTMKGGQLVTLFEGTEPGVLAQVHRTLNLISPYGEAKVVAPERENDLWKDYARRPWEGHSNIGTGHVVGLKIGIVPSALGAILHEAAELARQHDVTVELVGHAGVGVLFAGVQGRYPETLNAFIQDLRSTAIRLGGYLVVLHAPHDAAAAVDVWGPFGDALPLMRRIKDQFDPSGVMSPGRFVGGL